MKYLLLLFPLFGCVSGYRNDALPPEPFRPKVYAGSHIEGGIVRKQDNEVVLCSDKQFSKFACMSYLDLIELQMIINRCEQPQE